MQHMEATSGASRAARGSTGTLAAHGAREEGAVIETRCKTPRLGSHAVRKRGSELREAKQVDALIDVGLKLRKDIRGKPGNGYERGHAIK
jgi:hypothetical protein